MSTATPERATKPPKPRLPPEKGREVKGVLLTTAGLLLGASFASHHPTDPSLLHQGPEATAGTANWIGPVGAELSALTYGLLGWTALALPLFLLVAGIRRLRKGDAEPRVGRGFGAAILLVSLPGLFQLAFGAVPWYGRPLASGGAFGELASGLLASRLNTTGAFLVLGGAVVAGVALLVQTTLGEVLAGWRSRLSELAQRFTLARHRRREQKEKKQREEERQRVIARHRDKLAEREAAAREALVAPPAPAWPLPPRPTAESGVVRVIERRGEPGFGLRRVASVAETEAPERGAEPVILAATTAARHAPPPPVALAPRLRRVTEKPSASPAPAEPLLFAPPPAASNLPPLNLLQLTEEKSAVDGNELVRLGEMIRQRCAEFGVEGTIEGISPGPVITTFELQPAPGVKVSQIVNLQDDLALALRAESVRIDRLAGRSTLGLEVPNRERLTIRLGSLLAKEGFAKAPSPLTMALGVTIHGEPHFADLATMPHLLVAGATGAGKSVGLQAMITSILYKAPPEAVQFIMIDPKRIELGVYTDVPHLRTPVVVEPKQASNVLAHMVAEMESRYKKLAKVHVRSIAHYNQAIGDPEHRKHLALGESEGEADLGDLAPLPYIVVIIDELADLMMVASAEVETAIARLAQMARAVGIHLIVATQRPSVDVLTGTIKANFPCRIAFATASRHDSRTILDQVGSERLLGKGDMLFMPQGTSRVMRLHGAYVSEQETAGLVRWLKKQGKPQYDFALLEPIDGERGAGEAGDPDDDLYEEAARLVVSERMASASFLQRRMRIGFSRASRLIDMMERDALVGAPQGSKPREVLVPRDYFAEIDLARVDD
ncbi:MAG TPA: DNA translocase FtsK [Thermoanaerobaculia bacterium]|nr:DNA translocase FtsK [Thermoanaerobaculia bacterium]